MRKRYRWFVGILCCGARRGGAVAYGSGVIAPVALNRNSLLLDAVDDATNVVSEAAREIVLGCEAMSPQMAASAERES